MRITQLFARGVQSTRSRRFAIVAAVAVAIAALVAISGVLWSKPDSSSVSAEPGSAAVSPARVRVAALGRLEPRSEVISVSAPLQDELQTLLVERGDQVKKDQVLGYLSTHDKQVADLAVSKARFEEAKTRLEAETAYGNAAVALAELQLRQVQELMPLRIANQEATVNNADAELANNKDILTSYDSLYERQVATRRVQEDQRTLVTEGEAKLKGAQIQLDLLKQQFVIDEANARAQLVSARAAMQQAVAAIALSSLERSVQTAAANVELTTIRAPIDGTILNILARPGSPVNSTNILTMGDTSRMRAVAEVYESDIGYIRTGQSAMISSPALPKPLKGTVVEIGQMVFKNDVLNVDPAARSDARVIEVRIELESDDLAARLTNLTVDVSIDVTSEPKLASGRAAQ
jgi:HlyD family secretion protein